MKNGQYSYKKIAEKLLLAVIISAAVFLFFYQTMLAGSPLSQVIHRVGSDAEQVIGPVTDQKETIILQLVNFSTLPKAKILINGQYQGDFTHPYVTLAVSEEDTIEVDCTFYEHPVVVKIVDSSKAILKPAKGMDFTGQKTIITIGKVERSEN